MDERNQLLDLISASQPVMQKIADVEAVWENSLAKYLKFHKKSSVGKIIIRTLVGFALWSFIGIIFMNYPFVYVLGYIAIIGYSVLMKTQEKKYQKLTAEYSARLEQLKSDSTLSWLPPDYRNSPAWEKIAGYIINMRADTLQDAINLYETEAHQERLENIAALGAMM